MKVKKVNEWFRKFGELKEKSCVILKRRFVFRFG